MSGRMKLFGSLLMLTTAVVGVQGEVIGFERWTTRTNGMCLSVLTDTAGPLGTEIAFTPPTPPATGDPTADKFPVAFRTCTGADTEKLVFTGESELKAEVYWSSTAVNPTSSTPQTYEDTMCLGYDPSATDGTAYNVYALPCDYSNDNQGWVVEEDGTFQIKPLNEQAKCLTIDTGDSNRLVLADCVADDNAFRIDATNTVRNDAEYTFDCGSGSGSISVSNGKMDFSLVATGLGLPDGSYSYTINTLWVPPTAGDANSQTCEAANVGGVYDPLSVTTTCAEGNYASCKAGNLSGKYGAVTVASGAASVDKTGDTSFIRAEHYAADNTDDDVTDKFSSIVFTDGTSSLCCKIVKLATPASSELNFATVLRETIFTLQSDAATDAQGGDLAAESQVVFKYAYSGPATLSRFAFPIYAGKTDPSCGAIVDDTANPPVIPWTFDGTTNEPAAAGAQTGYGLTVESIVYDQTAGEVSVTVGIDLTTISTASTRTGTADSGGDGEFWDYLESNTKAELFFCAKFQIFYKDPGATSDASDDQWLEVNYHETNLIAGIDMKEDGGMEKTFTEVNMDRAAITEARPDVSIEFPVRVDFCADDTTIIANPPAIITQGFPIQLCVRLDIVAYRTTPAAPPTTWENGGAYVRSIWMFDYDSEDTNTDPTLAVSSGQTDVLTELDCAQVDGVCRLKWVPLAKYFRDRTAERDAADGTAGDGSNNLIVRGKAVIGFGFDPNENSANPTRKLASIRGSFAVGDVARKLQEGEEGLSTITDEKLGAIREEKPQRKNPRKNSAASAVAGLVVPAFLAVVGFFF